MKNTRLLIVTIFAGVIGYFAYPYFHSPSTPTENSVLKNTNVSERKTETLPTETSNSEKTTEANVTADQNVPTELLPASEARATEDAVAKQNPNSIEADSGIKQNPSPSTTFSNSPHASGLQKNDFSSYKLTNNESRLSISETDPRLLLLQGKYEGIYKGSNAQLFIGNQMSSLILTGTIASDDITLRKPNEQFFSNVFENGNLLTIESDKQKIQIDISGWPKLKMLVGQEETVYLSKI